jgi:hypothetical protein
MPAATIDLDRLDGLLGTWHEELAAGRELSPEELCRECLELVGELARRIRAIRRIEALVASGADRTGQTSGGTGGPLCPKAGHPERGFEPFEGDGLR